MLLWKSLTPERKPKLFQFYSQEGKYAFTRPGAWFSFPFSFISVLLQPQAMVVHTILADSLTCCPCQGLHHLGGSRVIERSGGSSPQCFSPHCLTSLSHGLQCVEQSMKGLVEALVFPDTTCCMWAPSTHSGSCTKVAVFHAEPSSHLPPCLQPGSLPVPFSHNFPAHPPTALYTFQVSNLPYFFLLPANPCSSISYSSRLLLHQRLESPKGQFIFMNVCIKHDLPKHSILSVRLTKKTYSVLVGQVILKIWQAKKS